MGYTREISKKVYCRSRNMTDVKIAVVDYDAGNTFSDMLRKVPGYTNLCLSRDKMQLASADCLILQERSFGSCMAKLKHFDLINLLNEQVLTRKNLFWVFVSVCKSWLTYL